MSFDLGQMFTPPKSKTPWEAMTTGATHKNTQLERWGPVINSMASVWGNMIFPGAGTVGGAIGGGIGMEGRDRGFQGTDYGWGNVMPTIAGATEGAGAGTPMGMFGNYLDTGGSYWNGGNNTLGIGYNTNYDRSKDPKGKQFDWSSLAKTLGSMVGSYYGGQAGGGLGTMLSNGPSENTNNKSGTSGIDLSNIFGSTKKPIKSPEEDKNNTISQDLFYRWLIENMLADNTQQMNFTKFQTPLQPISLPYNMNMRGS